MLARRLRPPSRNRPEFRVKVDFVPTRRQCLAGSRRSQNGEFERARRRRRPPAKLGDESGNVGVRAWPHDGRARACLPWAGACRDALSRRECRKLGLDFAVVSRPSWMRRRRAASLSATRRTRRTPQRLENRKHGFHVHLIDRQGANWLTVTRERHRPLRLVLVVSKRARVRSEVFVRRRARTSGLPPIISISPVAYLIP